MIEIVPEIIEVNGRRTVRVSLREEGQVIDADTVNPANATQRRRVAQRLAARAGDAHGVEEIERALLACLPMLDQEEQTPPQEPEQVVRELRIARPELIIDADLCGIAVPEVVIRGDRTEGRWRLYLSRGGDRRDSVELPPSLQLDEGRRIWFNPMPAPPPVPALSAWSAASRAEFLAGCPHPPPVEVFLALCAAFDDYLELPAGTPIQPPGSARPIPPAIAVLALWTMLSYCYPAWDAVPYLYVCGPAGSGKTRVFELLSRLALRPIVSSNLSAAALFRTLHERGGVLLLDEAERLNEGGPEIGELRSILLAGYRKGGRASRLEAVGDGFAMTEFQVFGPKAIGCINALPGPLASRCIPLSMLRAAPDSPKPRRRIDEDPQRWQDLRDRLHLLALISMGPAAGALARLSDCCPLSGRNYELWQPLLALAEWVDADGALELARKVGEHARVLLLRSQEELADDAEQTLLRTLCEMVREGKCPTNQEVLDRARRIDADTFTRGWSARRLAEVLRRYGLSTIRSDRRREYRNLNIAQFKAIERNYGFDLNTDGELRFNLVRVRSY